MCVFVREEILSSVSLNQIDNFVKFIVSDQEQKASRMGLKPQMIMLYSAYHSFLFVCFIDIWGGLGIIFKGFYIATRSLLPIYYDTHNTHILKVDIDLSSHIKYLAKFLIHLAKMNNQVNF